MIIYSVVADSKPQMCIECRLASCCNKGIFKDYVRSEYYMGSEWKQGGTVPGPECPIIIKQEALNHG